MNQQLKPKGILDPILLTKPVYYGIKCEFDTYFI